MTKQGPIADLPGFPIAESKLIPVNENEIILLQRISLGLNYISVNTCITTILKFGFKHVIDILDPISTSIWKSDANQAWTLCASDGKTLPLPAPFTTWSELNSRAILIRESLPIYIPNIETREIAFVHWIIPFVFPGGFCYAFHVLTPKSSFTNETVQTFLTAFALLLIMSDQKENQLQESIDGEYPAAITSTLTQRQKDILELSSQGLTYAQIGRRLGFSESTIKQEAMKIFSTLGVHKKSEALKSLGI